MKIIRTTLVKKTGAKRVTVEIPANEVLVAVDQNIHYRLGEPMEEIIGGHSIYNARPVHWCPVGQKWED